jgi:hypothetical protein
VLHIYARLLQRRVNVQLQRTPAPRRNWIENDPSAPVLRREQKLRNQREARRLIGLPRYQACAMPRLQLDGITQLDHQFS